jgi:ParB-like chromosome segregation protein Spo0J
MKVITGIDGIKSQIADLLSTCQTPDDQIIVINDIRKFIHSFSPFKSDPVDCVEWIKAELIEANDYNPNTVAPPEMKLLEVSILQDGYTQPIVAWKKTEFAGGSMYEVVDGFHRNRIGKESPEIKVRTHGYLPVTVINSDRIDRSDRIASTIRHNRARGKHQVTAMSDIVVELKNRNWKNERIAKELGMEEDEILRLCQITGLENLFADQEFSKSWDVEGEVTEQDFQELSDDVSTYGEMVNGFRVVNSDDEMRIFHQYEKWECYKAGFYNTKKDGKSKEEWEEEFKEFLGDSERFTSALEAVITEWKYSCEHYLTNSAMNRIAWLGQASACYALGLPHIFCGGFNLLSLVQQNKANEIALVYLNKWLAKNGRDASSMETALSHGRQSDIY